METYKISKFYDCPLILQFTHQLVDKGGELQLGGNQGEE